MSELSALPPGYTVMREVSVGYSYMDETGNIIFQHPYDNENARTVVWRKYSQEPKKAKARK